MQFRPQHLVCVFIKHLLIKNNLFIKLLHKIVDLVLVCMSLLNDYIYFLFGKFITFGYLFGHDVWWMSLCQSEEPFFCFQKCFK